MLMYEDTWHMRVRCTNTDKLKQALVRSGKSQKDLSVKGLSQSAISKFFRGETVDHKKTAGPIVKRLKLEMLGPHGVVEIVERGTV